MSWTDRLRRQPLALPLAVGAVLRLIAALSGFGWFATDDYTYAVEQSWRWLENPELAFPSAIRSPLFPRIFYGVMTVADTLGLRDPAAVLHFCYGVLGMLSLALIPGVYRLSRRRLGEQPAVIAAWLVALFALMPRISTRGLLGPFAAIFLVWGLVFADEAIEQQRRSRQFIFGVLAVLVVGFAAMVRFQIGLVVLPITVVLFLQGRRFRRYDALWGWLAGGLLVIAAQALLDSAIGRAPLGTIFDYLSYNSQHSTRYGVSAWYTYLLHFLVFTVPPATLIFARPMWAAARAHPLVSGSWAFFVLVHSFIAHKEERFIFAVLPLFLILLAAGLYGAKQAGPWGRRAIRFFWAVNALALIGATFSDSGRSITVPLLHLHRHAPDAEVAVVRFRHFPYFYLGRDAKVQRFAEPEEFLRALETSGYRPDYVYFRRPGQVDLKAMAARGLQCDAPVIYQGDWVDRTALTLNPEHNKRRRPTALCRCRVADTP